MQPSNSNLDTIFKDLCAPENVDPALRARVENVLYEERIHPARWARYEAEYPPAAPICEAWAISHNDYLQSSVFTELPETFGKLNVDAALPPAVTSDWGREQILIRVESLDHVINEIKACSLEELEHCLAVYDGSRKDDTMNQGDAKHRLEEVCRSLNTNPYATRPRFAAFGQEMQEETGAPDWANRLRDRLGLAHFPPPTFAFGPYPVMLMRYKVGEVADRAAHAGVDHALALPTALDAEPYEIFHPAPKSDTYGRTLNLAGSGDECDRLASEVLHLRMDYKPSHIWKVGAITTRADTSPERVAQMRQEHLFCLRYLSGNEDFGKL